MQKTAVFQVAISQMKDWFSGKYTSITEDYNIIILKGKPVSPKFIPKDTIVSNVIDSVTVVFRDDERYIHQIYIKAGRLG